MALKSWLLKREIRKGVADMQRNRSFHNLESARTFGVVFDASKEADYNRVSGFVRHIQSHHKQVKALGLIQAKEKPHFILERIAFDFITLKDLSFNLRPKNAFVKDFLEEEYDVLVDFNIKKHPVLIYLTALSHANFKIGLYDEEMKDYLDFMIQTDTKLEIAGLAKETLHFLETLHAKETK
jgi:hypothetical protein